MRTIATVCVSSVVWRAMKTLFRFVWVTIFAFVVLGGISPQLRAADELAVVLVGNEEVRDASHWARVEGALRALDERGVEVIYLKIRTTTGFDAHVADKMMRIIPSLNAETVALVDGSALSGGALAALLSDRRLMTASAVIGDLVDLPSMEKTVKDDDGSRDVAAREARLLKTRVRAAMDSRNVPAALVDGLFGHQGRVRSTLGLPAIESEDADAPISITGKEAEKLGLVELVDALPLHGDDIRTVAEAKAWGKAAEAAIVEKKDEVVAPAAAPMGKVKEDSYAGKVVVIKVGEDSLVNTANFEFMKRMLKRADAEGAVAVVFDMDTPGGFVWQTLDLMLAELTRMKTPVYTFVNSRAISAGALVAMSTNAIYMAPSATIGSAGVVTGGGEDVTGTMEQKINSTVISSARNAAITNGHNPDIVEAFIDSDKEVIIDGEVISAAGEMLNLNTPEATRMINGRPVLAKGVANSVADVLEAEGITAEVVVAERTGFEAFAYWAVKLAPLLIMLGIAGAYIEMKSPGLGVPGAVAAISFAIYFFGANMAGKLAGWELVALFVLGIVLILLEIFVLPTAFIFALVGSVMVFAALALGMVDKAPVVTESEGWNWSLVWDGLVDPLFNVSLGIFGGMLMIMLLMRFLPSVPLFHRFVLAGAVPVGTSSDAGTIPMTQGEPDARSWLGKTGVAKTILRPAGVVEIDGKDVDVVTSGGFVAKGAKIEVIAQEGMRVVVREP